MTIRPHSEMNPEILKLNKRHAVVKIQGKIRIVDERFDQHSDRWKTTFMTRSDFIAAYENIKFRRPPGRLRDPISLGEAWLECEARRQYEDVIFDPSYVGDTNLNLWRGFPITPEQGDWSKIREFIHDVICDGNSELFEHTIAFIAHMLQKPGELPEIAVVLQGDQGCGKTFFMKMLGRLVPDHFIVLGQTSQLTGRFGGHLFDKLLVCADEGSFKSPAAANRLKALITTPQISMERKGIDIEDRPNFMRLIIASNDKSIIRADARERRFLVLGVNNNVRENMPYFAGLEEYMLDGGLSAMIYDLQNFNLSKINLRKVPKTGALYDQQLESMEIDERWLLNCLTVGEILPGRGWTAEINCRDVLRSYQDYCMGVSAPSKSDQTKLGKLLHRIFPSLQKPRRQKDWRYRFPDLKTARAEFEEALAIKVDWPEEYFDADIAAE